jgi:glutathione peroxidase-family protein
MCTRLNQDRDQSRDSIKHLDLIVIDNNFDIKWNFNKFIFFLLDSSDDFNKRIPKGDKK